MIKSIQQIWKAFGYSLNGLKSLRKERAFNQEILFGIVVLFIAKTLSFSTLETMYTISSLLLILIIEIINSAIESVVDRISIKKHELSKKAKDLGSAAVLISFIHFFIVLLTIISSKI